MTMASAQPDNKQWKLEKYARFMNAPSRGPTKSKSSAQSANKWKLFNGDKEPLTLTLTGSHHLLITSGKDLQENHSLWNAQSWMKGISKEESILFIYKIQDETRQFRVKFASTPDGSGLENCQNCVAILSKYFIFKKLGGGNITDTQKSSSQELSNEPSGETTMKKLAQILTGELKEGLPRAYLTTHLPTEPTELQNLVELCLTDTNFPAFVGAVEQSLDKVLQNSD